MDKEEARNALKPASMSPFGLETTAKFYINDQKEQ